MLQGVSIALCRKRLHIENMYINLTAKEDWNTHPLTGAYYQLNTQSALTWSQAETSCKQQGASLLSITDPHEQAYVQGKVAMTLH